MTYTRLLSTGSYLPQPRLKNADLEHFVETTDEWIVKRVGIRERPIVGHSADTVVSMALQAAQRALAAAELSPQQVELIIVATATADYLFPSVACIIQGQLGITNECAAFDINVACAGFIYALSIAEQYITAGAVKTALVVGVDALSKVIDWTDRTTCVLFGDAAGAVVLQAAEQPGLLTTQLRADGRYHDLLSSCNVIWSPDGSIPKVQMKGREIFKIAVTKLNELVETTLTKASLKQSDIDWLVPHQANKRIIEAIAKRLALPMTKVIVTIENHGNTSAASIPLALDTGVQSGQIQRGHVLLLAAFGAGLAWGSTVVQY